MRAIAKQTGLSRSTIKRALSQTVPTLYKGRPQKAKKLDPFLPYLEQALSTRPWAKASRLYQEIARQGFGGHYELVKVFVRQQRQQQAAAQRACVRFETEPGLEAQFDWKGPVTGLLQTDPHLKVWIFRLLLGYSRFRITRAVTDAALSSVLADLIWVFERLGGLPQRIVFDNFKAAVLRPRPNLRLQPFFADFCCHYGIEPSVALVYSPQRKGKVERAFLDLEQSEILRASYGSLAALQRALDLEDARHAQQVVSTTGQTPAARFEREQAFLSPLPGLRFDPRLPETRRVLADCTISFAGAYYSVPHHLVGKRLTVKTDRRSTLIEIFDGSERVAFHDKAQKGERRIVEAHVAQLRQARWDRVRQAKAQQSQKQEAAEEAVVSLVTYPQVGVQVRALSDYASFVEEVTQ